MADRVGIPQQFDLRKAFQLLGFHKDLDVLCALVEQPFVKANEKTDLNMVIAFSNQHFQFSPL